METIFYVRNNEQGIWWGPYATFVESQKNIKSWCDAIARNIDTGVYTKDYPEIHDFEIVEIQVQNATKVKYVRETKDSRVQTLTSEPKN